MESHWTWEQTTPEFKKDKMKRIIIICVGLGLFIWSMKFIFSVVIAGGAGQVCRLNERIKANKTVGVIDSVYIPESSKGALMFVLKDGTSHPYSKSAFGEWHSKISNGDTISKPRVA